jgi:hypothetical protein
MTLRRLYQIICGLGIVVVALGILLTSSKPATGTPRTVARDQAAVRDAVSSGLLAAQQAPLPPTAARGRRLDAGISALIHKDGRASLARHFAAQQLVERTQALDAAISEETTGDVAFLDSGIDGLVVSSISVSGDDATAVASGTVWLDVAQIQDDGSLVTATPRNLMNFTFGLHWDGASWLIVSQSGTFAPGNAP